MSTAQDHTRIAAELTDVFGPGAGSSGYNFNSGGASGPQGSGGSQGSAGSPIANFLSTATSFAAGNKGGNAADLTTNVLANKDATLEELINARDAGRSAQNALKSAAKFGEFTGVTKTLGAAGKVFGGELGTGGSAAVTSLKALAPGVGMASGVGSLLGKYDLINPPLNKAAELVNKVPGMEYVNRGLQNLGTGIRKIPGTGTASLIAGGLSEFPDEILSVLPKIWRSFGDKAKAAAKSSREFALNDMFEEYAKNDPYSTPPGGWVGTRTVPGGYGERQYNEEIPFQAETKDLWEEYKNTDSYKTVLTAQQGIRDLEEIRGQEALKKLQNERAISELTDPVVNIQPVATHADLGIGTHYSDEYGTYDVETGEKLDVPGVYDPAPGFPITEPIQFEAPVAPAIEYYGPKAPTPVETAPTVRSDELDPMPRRPRVRPEELVTPRIMTPRRIRPQKETAPSKMSRHEQDLANYEMLVKAKQEADRKRYHEIASGGYARPGMGWGRISFNSSRNNVGLESKPKHNLRELPTGLNASSY